MGWIILCIVLTGIGTITVMLSGWKDSRSKGVILGFILLAIGAVSAVTLSLVISA